MTPFVGPDITTTRGGSEVAEVHTSDEADRVARSCAAMEEYGGPIPTKDLAATLGCSPRQLQRDFRAVIGTSPSAYGRNVRIRTARRVLRTADTVTDAVYRAGYGSSRGFYEQAGPRLGTNAAAFARGSEALELRWAVAATDLGDVLVVTSERGLCAARLEDPQAALAEVAREYPRATFTRDDPGLRDLCDYISSLASGHPRGAPIALSVQATAFEERVWTAVLRIPAGSTATYSEVAAEIGEPTAVRAVASAVGRNPIALAIPCHRVVRADGSLGGYRWGLDAKEALLRAEATSDTSVDCDHDQ